MPRPKVHDAALRERLLDRAGVLLSDGGTDALSLRTLAQDCGTSTTAVYSLFGGKPALLDVLLDRAVHRLTGRLDAVDATTDAGTDPLEHLRRLALAYRDAALDDPRVYEVLSAAPPAAQALRPFADAVRRATTAGALRPGADPSAVALAVQALVHGLVDLELHGLAPAADVAGALRAMLDGWRAPDYGTAPN